jgi:hypothetical protein
LSSLPSPEQTFKIGAARQRTYIELFVRSVVVVVVVVGSGEEAQPETRTVVRARAAIAMSLFFIAVNSHAEEKLDASRVSESIPFRRAVSGLYPGSTYRKFRQNEKNFPPPYDRARK